MKNILEVKTCYSCRGCMNICNSDAIRFEKNQYGISCPKIIESRCTECSLCIRKCEQHITMRQPEECILVETKEERELLLASSGGAFYKLADIFLKREKSIVYGAMYDENMVVVHAPAYTIHETEKFRKSKYVQSEMGTCFQEIEGALISGQNVLFSGTPCQVSGLLKYLSVDYDNLVTIDLMCTGVMIPVIFSNFLDLYKQRNVTSFDWRYKHQLKDSSWNIMDSSLIIAGERYQDRMTTLIKKLYGKGYGYMDSCYQCRFATVERCSDITLGDFWGEKSVFGYRPNRGTSAVLLNTEKGQRLFQQIHKSEIRSRPVELSELTKQNPSLCRPKQCPIKNKRFLDELQCKDIRKLLVKYTRNRFFSSVKMTLAVILPAQFVKSILRNKQNS